MNNNVLCIDIGGTNIKYTLFKEGNHGEIKDKPTPQELKIPDITSAIFKIIDEVKSEEMIHAVSISTCGQMRDNKVVAINSRPSYMGCDWKKIIFDKYNLPAIAHNDLHCSVMGDYHFGIEDKPNNFITMAIGTGINIGVILNGKVFAGDNNLSCYLDNMGDLQGENRFKSASAKSLLTLYTEMSGNEYNGKQFVEKLKENDAVALDAYNVWTSRVAQLLRNVSFMYDINNINLCGGLLNADYPIVDDIKRKYIEITPRAFTENIRIKKSNLSSPQLYGAYAYVVTNR